MSRSYRKPIATDGYKSRWKRKAKRQANKSVKHADDLPTKDKGAYKKQYNSWNICDFKFPITGPKARRK